VIRAGWRLPSNSGRSSSRQDGLDRDCGWRRRDRRRAGRELDQARRFITLNRDVLLEHWDYKIDTDELRRRLKAIDP